MTEAMSSQLSVCPEARRRYDFRFPFPDPHLFRFPFPRPLLRSPKSALSPLLLLAHCALHEQHERVCGLAGAPLTYPSDGLSEGLNQWAPIFITGAGPLYRPIGLATYDYEGFTFQRLS